MPYKYQEDKISNNKINRQKWLLEHRCCHCGRKLPESHILKNCSICTKKRKIWGWNQKLEAHKKISGLEVPICVKCSVSDLRILTINHREHGGRQERLNPERGGYNFYQSIISGERQTNDLEIRCYNCNILYEYETGMRCQF